MSTGSHPGLTFQDAVAELDRSLREIQDALLPEFELPEGSEEPVEPPPVATARLPVHTPPPVETPRPVNPPARVHPPAPADEPRPSAGHSPRGRSGPLAELLARSARHPADDQEARAGSDRGAPALTELASHVHQLLLACQRLLESLSAAENELALSAGPFSRPVEVRELEQRLAALPGVREVRLRGYEGAQRAVFDVQIEPQRP